MGKITLFQTLTLVISVATLVANIGLTVWSTTENSRSVQESNRAAQESQRDREKIENYEPIFKVVVEEQPVVDVSSSPIGAAKVLSTIFLISPHPGLINVTLEGFSFHDGYLNDLIPSKIEMANKIEFATASGTTQKALEIHLQTRLLVKPDYYQNKFTFGNVGEIRFLATYLDAVTGRTIEAPFVAKVTLENS